MGIKIDNNIETIFFDKDALREPNYKLKRFMKKNKRYYYKFDDFLRAMFFPSVTTVLDAVIPENDFLKKWREEVGVKEAEYIMNYKAEYGTIMHILIAYFLVNKKINLNTLTEYFNPQNYKFYNEDWIEDLQSDLTAFAKFANDVQLKPLAIELMLCSEKYMIAGSIDLVAEITWKGKRIVVLIDFKSSRKNYSSESHELQLGYYKIIWEENFPKIPIERVFNWKPKDYRTTTPTYTFTDQTDKIDNEILESYLKIYYKKNTVKPTSEKTFFGDLILGKETENVSFTEIDDIVKNYEIQDTSHITVSESGELFEESWDFETTNEFKSNVTINNYEDF